MPRSVIDLEPHKAQIIELYHQNTSSAKIATFLWDKNFEIKVSERTIKGRLQTWEQRKRYPTQDTIHQNSDLELRVYLLNAASKMKIFLRF